MKFCLLLLVIPSVSNGFFYEHRSFRGDESDKLFYYSVLYLMDSMGGLSHSAKRGYGPAQHLLALLKEDSRKAEEFLKEYNKKNLRPKLSVLKSWKSSAQHRQDSRLIRLWKMAFPSPDYEPNELELSWFFSETVASLSTSFHLLSLAKERHVFPEQLQIHFAEQINDIMQLLGIPVYPASSELISAGCQTVFVNNFISTAKKSL